MKRTGFLSLAAAGVAVLLAGCVSGYQYREGNGDYYYGQPSVEYRDYGYGGYDGYGYPGGWSGSLGWGYRYGGYGYGGYGYPWGGYGYPYYPPLIYVPRHHGHHGGHDQPDPVPYRPDRPRRIGGDGTSNTPIMMPSAPRPRVGGPRTSEPGMPRMSEPSRPRPMFIPPPMPRAQNDGLVPGPDRTAAPARIQVPQRSSRDRDDRRSSHP
jgi:hypothetical protein